MYILFRFNYIFHNYSNRHPGVVTEETIQAKACWKDMECARAKLEA